MVTACDHGLGLNLIWHHLPYVDILLLDISVADQWR